MAALCQSFHNICRHTQHFMTIKSCISTMYILSQSSKNKKSFWVPHPFYIKVDDSQQAVLSFWNEIFCKKPNLEGCEKHLWCQMKFQWTAQYNLIAGWRPLAAWSLWIITPTGHEECICATEKVCDLCACVPFSLCICVCVRVSMKLDETGGQTSRQI